MENVGHKTLETMAFARWYNKWIFSLIKKDLGEDILEVGAGIGNFTDLLKQAGKVVAIDIDKKYLSNLKRRFGRRILVGFGDIEKNTLFFSKSQSAKKFDSIVCLNVLEHIQEDLKALENMAKLLKPKGKLFLLVPAHKILFSKFDEELGHYRRYTKNDVESKLKRAGFNDANVFYLNWWGALGWFFFIKLFRNTDMPRPPVLIFDLLGRLFLLPEKLIKPPFGLSVFAISQKK